MFLQIKLPVLNKKLDLLRRDPLPNAYVLIMLPNFSLPKRSQIEQKLEILYNKNPKLRQKIIHFSKIIQKLVFFWHLRSFL